MESKDTEINLIIDFKGDWLELLWQKLIDDGYFVDPNQETFDTCVQYFNILKRRIEVKPRKVLISKEFSCPNEYTEGLHLIHKKVTSGQDLTPHLSKAVKQNLNFHDLLLNDWGIYHFHLGTSLLEDGFVVRTGPLLFARVTDDSFYMLGVFEHGKWSKQCVVEIIHNNWQESISLYKLQSIKGISTTPLTDEDIAEFRKHGISSFIRVSDGTIYSQIGGGYAVSKISMDVLVTCKSYDASVRNLERYVRDNLFNLVEIARQHGIDLPSQLHFHLKLKDSKASAVELGSQVAFELGEMPIRLMGQ